VWFLSHHERTSISAAHAFAAGAATVTVCLMVNPPGAESATSARAVEDRTAIAISQRTIRH
jgi:hypothetical protein